ncbi:MAG: Endonuclease/Exonuclease/phosphatase family [Anaerocolumna sp.]|nr:Endonuclease/Exonuclease/phosphatase family [Anaerocolumna sp.]
MKILSININPPDKCAEKLTTDFKVLSTNDRINRIIELICNKNPDAIFFIEQWYPVFKAIEMHLKQNGYIFHYPHGFDPSFFKGGAYPSYAGVVTAFKSSIQGVKCEDGSLWVKETAKWLCLEIQDKKYLGVHYPQPGHNWDRFHAAVKDFVYTKKPLVIMGDFNTPKGDKIEIDGYKDLLGGKDPTSAFNTKLDYIFAPSKFFNKAESENIEDVMKQGNSNFFSDHSATMAIL